MFNPLLPDLSTVKDQDLENIIIDLSRKYHIAARSGNGALCNQISITLEQYKDEQRQRNIQKNNNLNIRNQNKDLDDLIKVS